MNRQSDQGLSLVSRGARLQFAVGIALISVIPLLAIWYLRVVVEADRAGHDALHLVVGLSILMAALGGFLILRKYPVNIVRLRGYLERMVHGELPDSVNLLKAEDDVTAVERYLNLIIRQLRSKLEAERSEKESLQHQLYQAQKMESLGVMAAGVAHDFNNFLTGILGNADLAMKLGNPGEVAQENLEDIKKLARRASDLTKTMLTYSGRGRFEMEAVDVRALVADLVQLLRASVGTGVEMKTDIPEDMPLVRADPAQLRQLVMNLVINAADAIGEKPGRIVVSGRAYRALPENAAETYIEGRVPEGEYVCLAVSDDGSGMPPEVVARIFDPFFTTKPDGRGLGLAIVLGIIRSHKAYVNVRSTPGKGTTFEVFLPCLAAV